MRSGATASFRFSSRSFSRNVSKMLCAYASWPRGIPFGWFSPTFNRSDLAAEYYDRLLFKGATFGDLAARPGAPFLINTVELHFNQLADDSDRRFFNSVPTRLQLPSATVDRLCSIAAAELARNEEFQRLIMDLRNGSNPINFPTGMRISQSTERNSQ